MMSFAIVKESIEFFFFPKWISEIESFIVTFASLCSSEHKADGNDCNSNSLLFDC